jgi:hypothetical protein
MMVLRVRDGKGTGGLVHCKEKVDSSGMQTSGITERSMWMGTASLK